MADLVTMDVVDRPPGRLRRMLQMVREIRAQRPDGMRALLLLGTARFVPRVYPAPTPRRIALLAAWEDGSELEARWTDALGGLCAGAREHWHVQAVVVRASFTATWRGWTPDATDVRPLDPGEPALILISGNLRARYVPVFFRDGARAVEHAFAQPGYLGGLGVNSSPLNTTSCSCWRTYKDARDYAFKAGGHADAMRRDRAGGHHATEMFLRLRPLVERGTLSGTAPFSAVLGEAALEETSAV